MATEIENLPYNNKIELPSRDIPRETIEHAADPQVVPNYVPPKEQKYIETQSTHTEPSKIDRFLDEFRTPIMLSILYFLFELPVVHSTLTRMAPTVFVDGTVGLAAKSVCFGALYYGALFVADYLSKP